MSNTTEAKRAQQLWMKSCGENGDFLMVLSILRDIHHGMDYKYKWQQMTSVKRILGDNPSSALLPNTFEFLSINLQSQSDIIDINGKYPTIVKVHTGKQSTAQTLIPCTALNVACVYGRYDIVELLLEYDAFTDNSAFVKDDPTNRYYLTCATNMYSLSYLLEYHPLIIRLLQEYGVSLDNCLNNHNKSSELLEYAFSTSEVSLDLIDQWLTCNTLTLQQFTMDSLYFKLRNSTRELSSSNQFLKLLARHGLDMTNVSPTTWTRIFSSNNFELVTLLLDRLQLTSAMEIESYQFVDNGTKRGIVVTSNSPTRQTLLHLLAQLTPSKTCNVLNFLTLLEEHYHGDIQASDKYAHDSKTVLKSAIACDNVEVVKWLLQCKHDGLPRVSITIDDLCYCFQVNSKADILTLILSNVLEHKLLIVNDVNVMRSILNGKNINTLQDLVTKFGFSLQDNDYQNTFSPLGYAIRHSYPVEIFDLVTFPLNEPPYCNTLLWLWLCDCKPSRSVLERLVRSGIDIMTIQESSGMTILHKLAKTTNHHCNRILNMLMPIVCSKQRDQVANWLKTSDIFGRTALQLACYYGLDSLVYFLLKYGSSEVSTMCYPENGMNALHFTVIGEGDRDDRQACMKLLLQHSPYLLNEVDHDGKTALSYALETSQTTLCQLLLKYQDILNM